MDNVKKDAEAQGRRNFLKTTAIASAAFMIVPRHVLGGKGFLAPSDRLIIAGVGVGGKGKSDIAAFAQSGKADIAYLCDVDTRRAADSVKAFPKAKFYKDWREMFEKEGKNFDAVSVSTPDHNHAIITMAAMQMGKHVYVQKPLTHDIYEARALTEAAKRYKVVTQMGNQGASNDGPRQMKEWYDAGLIGDVHTIYAWTDRPVWPQGIPWSANKADIPKELDWDLWLGTAPYKDYVEKLVPFNWRGWWDYGTGALGDMGCHLLETPFSVLNLKYATEVQASVGSVYVDEFKRGYFPDSCPPSSHVTLKFPKTNKTNGDIDKILISGGSSNLSDQEGKEATVAAAYLRKIGIPDTAILIENQSRNTVENAKFSRRLVEKVNPSAKVLVITSAWHIPRVRVIFSKYFKGEIYYYPTNYMGKTSYSLSDILLPSVNALISWQLIFKEWIGLFVDRFRA